jgi:hypothetical protein
MRRVPVDDRRQEYDVVGDRGGQRERLFRAQAKRVPQFADAPPALPSLSVTLETPQMTLRFLRFHRFPLLHIFLLSLSPLLHAQNPAAQTVHEPTTFEVNVEYGASAKMRDGITLRADIYRPAADGKYPVLLKRTPYNKSGSGHEIDFARKAASRGYIVIMQDVRGRYSSDGDWYPFLHEADDGYDTVEWAAALPYSDGRVGMWSGSYVGATQMLAAIALCLARSAASRPSTIDSGVCQRHQSRRSSP